MEIQEFYSNGKLLLTGEYVVLDGAMALAVPTRYGQSLTVEPITKPSIIWESYTQDGSLWFEIKMEIKHGEITNFDYEDPIAERLLSILKAVKKQQPLLLPDQNGLRITTHLDFPRNWGLGTSSTLINNIAQWSGVDPYQLLADTFGGSGYDIACARHNVPITYELSHNTGRTIIERDLNFPFEEHIYFVFLNKKQNSREGIATYKNNKGVSPWAISEITAIGNDMLSCGSLTAFQFLMESHESIISEVIKQKPVKEVLFKDFNGSIKSLGAWGGDFVMVATDETPDAYFKSKGYDTIIPYRDLIL